MGKYDDVIGLPHPEPQTRPRMSMHAHAAQFAPFVALHGHHAAIIEAERLTDRRIELDEYETARIDSALQQLQERIGEQPTASITYFVPGEHKAGGSYRTVTGTAKRTDSAHGVLIFSDGQVVSLTDILEVDDESC